MSRYALVGEAAPVQLLTTAEVARAFAVKPPTVRRWVRAGKLVPIRTLGGHARFYADQVDALLADSSTPAGASE